MDGEKSKIMRADYNLLISCAWQLYGRSDEILSDERLCSVPVHVTFGPVHAPVRPLGAIVALWRESEQGLQRCWPESGAAREHSVPVGTPGLLCCTNGLFGSGTNTTGIVWATGDVTSECLSAKPYISVVAEICSVLKRIESNSENGTLGDACRQLGLTPQPMFRLDRFMAKKDGSSIELKDILWGLSSLENAQSAMQRYIATHNSRSMRRRCRGYRITELRLNAEGAFEPARHWTFTPDGTPG